MPPIGLGISVGDVPLGSSPSLMMTSEETRGGRFLFPHHEWHASDVRRIDQNSIRSPLDNNVEAQRASKQDDLDASWSTPLPSELSPPFSPSFFSPPASPILSPLSSLEWLSPPEPSPVVESTSIHPNAVVISLSVLCGVLALGLSATGALAFYKRKTKAIQEARIREAMEREARASFSSLGTRKSGPSQAVDPRSEWIRLGLDSPNLIFPEKSRSRVRDPKSKEDAKTTLIDAAPVPITSRVKHNHAPAAPSPLGIHPVLTAPIAPQDTTVLSPVLLDMSPRKVIALNAPPLSSSSSPDVGSTIYSISKEAALPPLPVANSSDGLVTRTNAVASESSGSSIASSESSHLSLSVQTDETGMTKPSSGDHGQEFTSVRALEKSVSEMQLVDVSVRFSDIAVPESETICSLLVNEKDPTGSLPSLNTSSTFPATLSVSNGSTASSASLNMTTNINDSSISMTMLNDAPLPPPTIIVSTPTNASLRTRALAAFQIGSLLVESWDDENTESDGTEETMSRSSSESEEWDWTNSAHPSMATKMSPTMREDASMHKPESTPSKEPVISGASGKENEFSPTQPRSKSISSAKKRFSAIVARRPSFIPVPATKGKKNRRIGNNKGPAKSP